MSLAIDIRAERLNRGLSAEEAARQMGVDPDTLRRAEGGETKPLPRNALRIAQFYGYQVTEVWPLPAREAA